ncbi:hypothetical protein WICPIJ_002669 [Wickerhamomyces pijperi]|uniref:Prefoldin subunit 2 n=1 Tax=Wickerhamomyces pijperi TaxID=599730 RepID=A0A9P8QB55_WICPI|nr:hypothetical protein WICPIJ_002669 [Wickerhamomyces pijperi]
MSQNANQELQLKYNNYKETLTELEEKLMELRKDEEEHKIVVATLEKTPAERRCFRMVGGALVEHTAGEQLPLLQNKLKNITSMCETITTELKKLREEFENWKKEKKIQIVRE